MPKKKTFVPYKKCSKKEQRRRNSLRRNSWNEVNPVSRIVPSGKVYNRKRENAAIKKGWPNPMTGPGHPSFLLVAA